MGQKDLTQKSLEWYPDVFADIINQSKETPVAIHASSLTVIFHVLEQQGT